MTIGMLRIDTGKAAWLAWVALGVALLAAILHTPRTSGAASGLRRIQTPAIAAEAVVGQSFRMNADGLEGIDVRPLTVGPVDGAVRFQLRDAEGQLLRTFDVPAGAIVRKDPYRFVFEPIADSKGRVYRFELSSLPSALSSGVALRAFRGEGVREGTLFYNGIPRWGDLAFQTHAPTRSTLAALLDPLDVPRGRGLIALAGLVAIWLALLVILRAVAEPDAIPPPAALAEPPAAAR